MWNREVNYKNMIPDPFCYTFKLKKNVTKLHVFVIDGGLNVKIKMIFLEEFEQLFVMAGNTVVPVPYQKILNIV